MEPSGCGSAGNMWAAVGRKLNSVSIAHTSRYGRASMSVEPEEALDDVVVHRVDDPVPERKAEHVLECSVPPLRFAPLLRARGDVDLVLAEGPVGIQCDPVGFAFVHRPHDRGGPGVVAAAYRSRPQEFDLVVVGD